MPYGGHGTAGGLLPLVAVFVLPPNVFPRALFGPLLFPVRPDVADVSFRGVRQQPARDIGMRSVQIGERLAEGILHNVRYRVAIFMAQPGNHVPGYAVDVQAVYLCKGFCIAGLRIME